MFYDQLRPLAGHSQNALPVSVFLLFYKWWWLSLPGHFVLLRIYIKKGREGGRFGQTEKNYYYAKVLLDVTVKANYFG